MRPSVLDLRLVAIVMSLFAVLGGCGTTTPPASSGAGGPSASAFVGPNWTAITIRGQAPVPGSEPTIQFVGGNVNGSGGCNHFSGGFRYDEATGAVAFDQLAMTAMACVDQRVGAVETAFSGALAQANQLALDGDGRLHLAGPGGEIVLAKAVAR